MPHLDLHGSWPDTEDLADALYVAADALDVNTCYAVDGRFHFTLGAGWSIALSSDSADRIRIETCLRSTPRSTMWCMVASHARLAGLVVRMANQVAEPV